MRSELGPIITEMAAKSQSVKDAIAIANVTKSSSIDAKALAVEALTTSNDAKYTASLAKIAATNHASDISAMKASLSKCVKDQASIYENQLRMEAYGHRNNLKFEGISETPDEITSEKIRTILNKMEVYPSVQMVACH